ncbi:hypothetical protein [Mesorhizobium sp. AA23]|uniref:hypothetical protein n=1 Tax=Mesorhizobium TaxID=68287 RepID=UPI000801A296|nr:hypothetical protein A9K66_08080 [Mesorhizobium sp. AA23]
MGATLEPPTRQAAIVKATEYFCCKIIIQIRFESMLGQKIAISVACSYIHFLPTLPVRPEPFLANHAEVARPADTKTIAS